MICFCTCEHYVLPYLYSFFRIIFKMNDSFQWKTECIVELFDKSEEGASWEESSEEGSGEDESSGDQAE